MTKYNTLKGLFWIKTLKFSRAFIRVSSRRPQNILCTSMTAFTGSPLV